jgi:hypothetical protein
MDHKHTPKLVAFFVCILYFIGALEAQESDNAITIMVKEKDFTFTALSYSSSSTSNKQLNDYYTIKVAKDSIVGSLPYFGNSYTAQINLRDGGINFTSFKFDYSFVEKKRGKYLVTIFPKDDRIVVQKLYMTIFSDGKTQLDVLSRNQEPTTFTGYISR